MKKNKKAKKLKSAAIILREKPLYEGDPITQVWQRETLKVYCRNKRISIDAYYYSDKNHIHWSDYKTFLKCLLDESFKPKVILFTSWEIMAPLLDRFPETFKILSDRRIELRSIKKYIVKNALNKL